MAGLGNQSLASVSAYPTAWRVEIVNDDAYRGLEYVWSEHDLTRHTRTLTNAAC